MLKSNTKANFLFYDKSEKIQLRISGNTKINYKNDMAKKSWGKAKELFCLI